MHIIIDIRTLQIPNPQNNTSNSVLTKWLSALLRMPSEDKITLLVDSRFEYPQLEVPLTGSYWKPASLKTHAEIYSSPNKKAEQVATHKINHFLLEQEADLFHLTNPFLSAIPVGYPPIACPCVVTIDDSITQPRLGEARLIRESQVGATYCSKIQALQYSTKIIANKQSSVNELAPWYRPINQVEIIDHTELSSSEIALVMRKLYAKTTSTPFNYTVSNQTALSDSQVGFMQLHKLTEQADTIDYKYKIESKVPLIGSRIARIRSHMTWHLDQAYFSFIIAKQVLFNQKLVIAINSVYRLLLEHEQWLDLSLTNRERTPINPAQDIIDEAKQSIQSNQIINAQILAGPLPEYGECLGRSFYQQLYLASLHNNDPDLSEAQQYRNQDLILRLNQLAQKTEAYYENNKARQLIRHKYHQKYESLSRKIFKDLSPIINILLPEYQFESKKSYIGGLINWMRQDLTSHLQEPYIDPILKQQVSLNQSVVNSLLNIYSLNPITLKELRVASKITLGGSIKYSSKKVIGPLIAWIQKEGTSHLYEPYIVPFFKRQEAFNQNVVKLLVAIDQKRNVIDIHESYSHLTKKHHFKRILENIKRMFYSCSPEDKFISNLSVSQTGLTNQILPLLIEQMDMLIEEKL